MPRIRTIKPEFWTDEKLAVLDPQTRLVYLGLISLADDYGRLIDNIKSLDGQLFPFSDESCSDALDTLASLQRILRYTAKSGQHLIQIIRWDDHQKVNHPGKEVLPAPTQEDILKPVSSKSLEKGKNVSRSSLASYHGPRTSTNDLGPSDSGESVSNAKRFPVDLCKRLHTAAISTGHITPYPRFRKALLDLYPATGALFVETDLVEALKAFYEAADGMPPKDAQFQTVERFVQGAGRWVELGKMPLANENGVTERGRLAVGSR
jgi:hypothetical protein